MCPTKCESNDITFARTVLQLESDAIASLIPHLDANFTKACTLIQQACGRVILIGMGKSGHVARKIAATFASTGTPAFFVHPAEAAHGDLGMITERDVICLLSNSGETPEILTLLPGLQALACPLIGLTGQPNSTLARACQVHLYVGVDTEACPLDLAPTTSTTACMAMGDALALARQKQSGFSAQDFAAVHPAGALGKRLTFRVKHFLTNQKALPIVQPDATITEAIVEMTAKGLGLTLIVEPTNNKLCGIFTDGDLRRSLDNPNWPQQTIGDCMTPNYAHITPDTMAFDALRQMEQAKITSLVVLNPDVSTPQAIGIIHLHDLLNAGLQSS